MWSAGRTELSIYLGMTHARVRRRQRRTYVGRFGRPEVEDLSVAEADESLRHLAEIVRRAQGERLVGRLDIQVQMASSMCRFLLIDKANHLRNEEEVRGVAAALLASRWGLDSVEWSLAVDPTWRAEALVAAVRRSDVRRLEQLAERLQARLISVRPWLQAAMQFHKLCLRPVDAVIVTEPDTVSLVAGAGRALRVHSVPGLAIAGSAALSSLLAGSIDVPLAEVPTIRWIEADTSDSALKCRRIDFADMTAWEAAAA